ncbi:PSP1 C-terminal conserved region-domain-containing protein [Choanephora cucurbitarum]|nr:PSP1 C-terminal conserved region-domain-containing protein [Choanephora cucurbitarum]
MSNSYSSLFNEDFLREQQQQQQQPQENNDYLNGWGNHFHHPADPLQPQYAFPPMRRNSATATMGLPWFSSSNSIHLPSMTSASSSSSEDKPFFREHRSMSYSYTQDAFQSPQVLQTIMQEEDIPEDIRQERTRSKSTAAIMNNIWNPSVQQDDNQRWVQNNRVIGSGRRLSLAPSLFNSSLINTNTNNAYDDLTDRMRRFSLAPTGNGLENPALEHTKVIHPSTSTLFNQRRHSLAGPTPNTQQQQQDEFFVSELAVKERLQSTELIENTIKTDDLGKGTRLDTDVMQTAVFYVVEFKGGRSDVYYAHASMTTQTISKSNLVIVEADRGRDLGKVTMENISREQLETFYTQLKNHNHSDDPEEPIEKNKKYSPAEIYIKRIFRQARPDEITLLMAKGQDESKALMVCQSKIKQKKLNMQVVDAEYQWDRRKLTFYFVAEKRVDFRELVRELFKLYKTRIWMCAVSSIVHLK